MRRIIGFIILLALIGSARGQTAYSYRYWFDNNLATLQTGSTTGETTIEIDISALAKGSVHALHLQGIDAREKWSPVHTQYFFIAKDADTESATARYWFDNDETTVQTAPTVDGLIDLDISHMTIGTHSVHYQTFNAAGEASPVRTQYFYMNELQLATLSCKIWIDDDEANAQTVAMSDDDIVLDVENLSLGMHDLHVELYDSNGLWLAEGSTTFEVKEPTVTITLAKAMSTFCSDKDVDFSDTPQLKAYIATGFDRQSGNILLSRVYNVPQYTGVVLTGEANSEYEVPCRETYYCYQNYLIGTTETIYPESVVGYTDYVLSSGVFVRLKDGGKVNAGKAYLHVPDRVAANVRELNIIFEDEVETGIEPMMEPDTSSGDQPVYDLQGRRVPYRQMNKGIYVIDGKKRLVK